MDELKRNGSGYYDPTAYKAMKNYENGGVNMEINKGEVWEVEHGRYIKTAIVLAHHGSYCSVLLLEDEYRESINIQINARGIKYSESGFVQYKFTNAFITFVRKLTDEEFKDVCIKVAKSLDLEAEIDVFDETILAEKDAEIEALKAHIKVLVEQNAEVHHSITERTVIELTVERDLYKAQYEKMLERLIGA